MDSDPTDSPPAKPRRRWWQFSLRLVLVLVTLSTLPLASLAMKLREAETQKQAVAAWVELDVDVEYSNRPRVPRWLGKWALDLMGKDAFYLESVSTLRRNEIRKRALVQRDLYDIGRAVHLYGLDDTSALEMQQDPVNAHRLAEVETELRRLQPLVDADFIELQNLDGIVEIELDGCEVTGATLAGITHLDGLETLRLTATRVTDAGMTFVGQSTNLRYLDLGDTKVTDASMAYLANLTELVQLELVNTKVTGAGLRHIRGLTSLQYFGPPGPLSDAGLACLENMTDLTLLYVGDRVTDAGLRHLRNMHGLRTLSVTSPISGEGLVHLRSLSSLRDLHLNQTDVSDRTVGLLADLPKLRRLDLSQTLVTDGGLVHLRGCENLTSLTLTKPHVTRNGVAELRKALPRCRINLEPWPKLRVGAAILFSNTQDRLVNARIMDDGSRAFHLGRKGSALYLVHKPGRHDAYYINVHVVEDFQHPQTTRLNRLFVGDSLSETIRDYLEAVWGNEGGIMHYDKNSRMVLATRDEILKRHGQPRGEQLLQLRAVWEELRERLSE